MSRPTQKPSSDSRHARQFVARVERLLDTRRWTYAELAVRMNVYRPMVSRMLEGKQTPSAATIEKVAAAFGVSADELLGKVGCL